MTSGATEVLATCICGIVYKSLGIKKSYQFSYIVATGGAVLIMLYSDSHETFVPIFLGLIRVGIVCAFNLVYLTNVDVFPTLFAATALGFCNFFARLFTVMSPQIAERPPPLPMITVATICGLGTIVI